MSTEQIKNMNIDNILKACILSIANEVIEAKTSSILSEEFGEDILKAIIKFQEQLDPSKNPTAPMAGMLEDLIRYIAKMIVAISCINPQRLLVKGVVSKEEENLLRRGIQDHLIELSILMLKKHSLNSHANLDKFLDSKGE